MALLQLTTLVVLATGPGLRKAQGWIAVMDDNRDVAVG